MTETKAEIKLVPGNAPAGEIITPLEEIPELAEKIIKVEMVPEVVTPYIPPDIFYPSPPPAYEPYTPLKPERKPLVIDIETTGGVAAVAYADPANAGVAAAGEKRIYGRDSDGNIVNQVHLKSTKEIELSNALGAIKLLANGNIDLNGVIIDPSGNIVGAGSITDGSSVVLGTHDHDYTDTVNGSPTTKTTDEPN